MNNTGYLIAELESLIKEWSYTACGDTQACIALDVSVNAGLLMQQGYEAIEIEDSNGSLRQYNLLTGLFS